MAIAGGGGLLAIAVLASGGSDDDGGGGTPGSGDGAMSNAAPMTATDAPAMLTAMEEASADWDASAWFSDTDAGDELTYSGTLQKTDAMMATALSEVDWLVLDAMTGSLTIAEAATDDAEVGFYTLLVTATDSDGETATHTVTLTIEDPGPGSGGPSDSNEPPTTTTLALASLTATEEDPASWDVSDWFTDPDAGDTLTYMVSGLPDWLVLDEATGALTVAAMDEAKVGTYTLTVMATDAATETATHTVTLTITDSGPGGGGVMNAAPAVVTTGMSAAPATLTEGVSVSLDVSDWFDDPDEGDDLTYTVSGLPGWLVLDEATGALTVAAMDEAEVGTYTLTVMATDAATETATHTVTLTITDSGTAPAPDGMTPAPGASNEAPTTTTLAETSLTVNEAAAETWDVTDWFDDPDGDTLTYAATGLPDWLELDAMKGELAVAAMATDDADVNSHEFTLTASDGGGEEATLTVTLAIANVAEAPVVATGTMAPPATVTATEGLAFSEDVSDWFDDPDGDTLTYAAMELQGAAGSQTAMALPTWLVLDAMTGALTIAAAATDDAQVGTYTLAVTASDPTKPKALTAVHTVTVEVANVNDAPVVAAEAAPAMLTAMEGLAFSTNVSGWFTDPDTAVPGAGEVLAYTGMLQGAVGSGTESALPAWLALDGATGALTIAAGATDDAEVGTHTLVITASDKAGAMAAHTTKLTIVDDRSEPTVSVPLSNRIAPATGGMHVLDLADFFTDLQENGTPSPANELMFAVSDSIDDTTAADENIITATLTGSMLTLTPGTGAASGGFGQQETVTITATDSDDKRAVAEFAITTRAHVLDTSTLAPAHGFIIQGNRAGDLLGWSVSGAGDVNGDGLDDLIVGAINSDDGGTNAGEAYIVYGKADPAAGAAGTQFGTAVTTTDMEVRRVVDTTNLAPAVGFIFRDDIENDSLGKSVSGAGDVNGDGIDDLIVGADGGDDGGTAAGEAYIVYGKTGPGDGSQFGTVMGDRRVLDTTALAPAAGFIIQGDNRGDKLGTSVSGAGDVNGDGLGDLVVGAHEGDDGGTRAGEAYVVYGKFDTNGDGMQFGTVMGDRQVLDTTALAPADGFIIQGDMENDRLGISVSGAGDVNGDGLADLIVGAHQGEDGGNHAGEAYVIYGKAVDDNIQFGTTMTIVVNASDSSMTRTISEGETVPNGFMVSEIVVDNLLDLTNLKPADGFILQGDGANNNLGGSVSGAGDVNGDGFDDLIAGANNTNTSTGSAYVVYGKANPVTADGAPGTQFGTVMGSRQVLDITSLVPADGLTIQGDTAGDQLGKSVSGAGDVNGDGLADLIVGADEGDDGGDRAGEAYIIYGKVGTDGTQFGTTDEIPFGVDGDKTMHQVLDTTDGLGPTDGFILQGDAADDRLGVSVSGAGDVNDDGFDDLIVGAAMGDDGGANAGEAYVVYGGTHLGEVVSHAQTLVGMAVPTLPGNPTPAQQEAAARAAFLHGGAGDDTLTAHADTTVLYGGSGDDTLELVDWSFRRVDGGLGDDTLVLGSGVELNFTLAKVRGKVRGIETLSLSDATAIVTLDQATVFALVDSRDNGGTLTDAGEALLRLEGTGMVVLSNLSDWNETPNAEGMADLYEQGSAKILVDDGLEVA